MTQAGPSPQNALQVFLGAFRGAPGLEASASSPSSAVWGAGLLWLLPGLIFVLGGGAYSLPNLDSLLVLLMYPVVEIVVLFIFLVAGQAVFAKDTFRPARTFLASCLTVGAQSIGLGLGVFFVYFSLKSNSLGLLVPFFVMAGIAGSAAMLYASTVHLLRWRSAAALWLAGGLLSLVMGLSIFIWTQLFSSFLPEWDPMMFL
jgi:hypothetical protein